MRVQVPSIILPRVWSLGTETEAVADVLNHVSIEFLTRNLQEKTIHIVASEVLPGVPGNLWAWVELSPYLTTTTGLFWAAIGGGGGALPPTAPVIIAGTGVLATSIHSFFLPWVVHSEYARLVVATPVLGATAWVVQAQFVGK